MLKLKQRLMLKLEPVKLKKVRRKTKMLNLIKRQLTLMLKRQQLKVMKTRKIVKLPEVKKARKTTKVKEEIRLQIKLVLKVVKSQENLVL